MKPTHLRWLGDHVVIVSEDGKFYHHIGRTGRKMPVPKTLDGAPLELVPLPSRTDMIVWQEDMARTTEHLQEIEAALREEGY